ncbi:cysteine hydrolase [Phaeovibrio sulfidiphilus]|uniref:Cysteine hydrolase n=1 Tax=Phaeovibrio sulfidiphilus TaxID=1220600 RepID=A0A8J7CE00_9PROT|nr:cysteine hydrolase family protein [Phaeovibrio sulfidiphilus]MBE1237429.1 cysteine hydrolase [Phaeovibrio sulfidiphilus]
MSKGLLLVDLQNDYFPGGRMELNNADAALDCAVEVLDRFRKAGKPVFHVQHVFHSPDAAFFRPGTPGADIHPRIAPSVGESLFVKHAPSAFSCTGLTATLRKEGVTELVVCGMMTHMCIDTTVRAALDHELPVTLVPDACATRDLVFRGEVIPAEVVQKAYLAALDGWFATLVPARDVEP